MAHFLTLYREAIRQQQLGLSDEDMQILRLIANGATNDEIGGAINWSRASVKRHVPRIFEKLGVASRPQAAAEAGRRGLI
jgi:two-component system NarL family response regulator